MSTVFSPTRARVTPAPASRPEPKLRIVYGAPFRPPRMPFVVFVLALLAAGLVGLLLLNTELQRGAFQVTALNQQANDLRDQQEQLERQTRALESPQNLADRSLRMGMVPNPNPVFLRLSDGQVLGVPAEGKKGTGAAMFGPSPVASPTPSVPGQAATGQPSAPATGQPTAPGAPATGQPSAPATGQPSAPVGQPSAPAAQQSAPAATTNQAPAITPGQQGNQTGASRTPPPAANTGTTTPTGG